MKCIVCLGNPGKSYEKTRHNMGFLVADALISSWDLEGEKQKYNSLYVSTKRYNQDIHILKPQTYMNHSGHAVREFVKFYKCDASDLIIIYDDIDLDYGMIRYRAEGSAGTHNGLKSIIQELGSSNIARLRVGIGPVATPYSLKDFVLQSFTKDEWCSVSSITAACVNFFDTFFVNGDRDAMNQFNNKSFL